MLPHPAKRSLHAISRMPSAELSSLLEVSADLAVSLDLDDVLQTAIESAVRVLGLETGAIYLLDGAHLILGATTPPMPAEIPLDFRREPLERHPHVQRCIADQEPVTMEDWSTADLTDAERTVCEARGLRSILFVPLLVSGEAIGAFIVSSVTETHSFSEHDVHLCRALSHEIALALANARLYESLQQSHLQLERAYDATLEGWSRALEMRDDETQGHAQRVSTLSVELGRMMGVPERELVHVRRGALLHDIGKMVVPDAILHKPGPLSEDEWKVMRRHPENARAFLARIDYLAPALDIPYCHHERWDGSGYPRGLAGEDIPLSARVFAVVDVFDALTSDRPYRPAWSAADALAHIDSFAGTHFDPRVVSAFSEMMNGLERPESLRLAQG